MRVEKGVGIIRVGPVAIELSGIKIVRYNHCSVRKMTTDGTERLFVETLHNCIVGVTVYLVEDFDTSNDVIQSFLLDCLGDVFHSLD